MRRLLGPAVEVVVVVHRLVGGLSPDAAHQRVGRIVAEPQRRRLLGAPEVLFDRLADYRGEGRPVPRRGEAQLLVGLRVEPEVGRLVSRHDDIMISSPTP